MKKYAIIFVTVLLEVHKILLGRYWREKKLLDRHHTNTINNFLLIFKMSITITFILKNRDIHIFYFVSSLGVHMTFTHICSFCFTQVIE